jgi:hypothetical protein
MSAAALDRELAHRIGSGLEVTLLWETEDDGTSIEITHAASGETLRFAVPPRDALDAFYHPFAHLPLLTDA